MGFQHDPRVTPTTAATKPKAGGSSRPNTTPTASSKGAPGKPPLPYKPGACFEIKPHNPPPPFGGGSYKDPEPGEWNQNPWPEFFEDAPPTMVEQCLQHQPWRTTLPPDQAIRNLKVTEKIRCKDPCNAQVVRCKVDGKDLVAKIFDPLYIDPAKCDELEVSPVTIAETYYSYEAAAYMRIKEKGLDGKYTPRFEGCWYMELPIHDANGCLALREVRLILQQFITGDTMQHLIERGEVNKIPPEVRVDLLDRVMEVDARLALIGVQSDDLHPRNFMVWKDANKSNEWQITLIDFSHSRVSNLPTSRWWTPEDTRLPDSPITLKTRCWPPHCFKWIPEELNCRTEESFNKRLEHMKKRWGRSKEYGPVIERRLPKYKHRG